MHSHMILHVRNLAACEPTQLALEFLVPPACCAVDNLGSAPELLALFDRVGLFCAHISHCFSSFIVIFAAAFDSAHI